MRPSAKARDAQVVGTIRDGADGRAVIGAVARHVGTGKSDSSAAEVVDAAAMGAGGVASDLTARDGDSSWTRSGARVAGIYDVIDAAAVGDRHVVFNGDVGERDRWSALPDIIRPVRYLINSAARDCGVRAEGRSGHRDLVIVVQAAAVCCCLVVAERRAGHVGIPLVFHPAAHRGGVSGESGIRHRGVVKVIDRSTAEDSGVSRESIVVGGQDTVSRTVEVDGAAKIRGVSGEGTMRYRHLDGLRTGAYAATGVAGKGRFSDLQLADCQEETGNATAGVVAEDRPRHDEGARQVKGEIVVVDSTAGVAPEGAVGNRVD